MISIVLLSLLQPITGALADRYGYLKMVVIGGVLGGVSSLACLFIYSWQQLFTLRAVSGVADAIAGPAILAIAASLSSERRGFVFGVFRSSQGLSFVVGPIVGVVIAKLFWLRAPFLFDFILTLVAIGLFVLFLRSVSVKGHGEVFSLEGLKWVIRNRELMKIAYIGFSEGFSFAIWCSFLPAYMLVLGMREAEIGLVLSVEALSFTIANAIVGYLSDILGRKPIAVIGATLATVASFAYLMVDELLLILLTSIVYGVECAMIFLMSTVMAVDRMPESRRASMLGAFDAIMDLGLALGPIMSWGVLNLFQLPLTVVFPIMGVATLLALATSISIGERGNV